MSGHLCCYHMNHVTSILNAHDLLFFLSAHCMCGLCRRTSCILHSQLESGPYMLMEIIMKSCLNTSIGLHCEITDKWLSGQRTVSFINDWAYAESFCVSLIAATKLNSHLNTFGTRITQWCGTCACERVAVWLVVPVCSRQSCPLSLQWRLTLLADCDRLTRKKDRKVGEKVVEGMMLNH